MPLNLPNKRGDLQIKQKRSMATTRLFRSSTLLNHVLPSSFSSSTVRNVRCMSKAGPNGEKRIYGDGERKSTVAMKASVATSGSVIASETEVGQGIDVASLLANITNAVLKVLRAAVKPRLLKLQVQRFIEKVIIDCRFFTLFAVAGSLLGSVLCFMEGCFLILESYFQYFHMLSQRSDEGQIVLHLLIEAIDMFLVGMAMLIFGMGLYVMFVGSKNLKVKSPWLPGSNLFGLFHLKTLPSWLGMNSVSQAKSKMGHAVMMILQVGLLEKFKSIPLVTSLDLACFAGSVLASSASIFLLSKLSTERST